MEQLKKKKQNFQKFYGSIDKSVIYEILNEIDNECIKKRYRSTEPLLSKALSFTS